MGRTKQTARNNTGGRKKSLKTKVRTQTDEVKFIKVVTPPKPAEAEQEVAGKVRGMQRNIHDEPLAFSAAHLTGDAARRWNEYGFKLSAKDRHRSLAQRVGKEYNKGRDAGRESFTRAAEKGNLDSIRRHSDDLANHRDGYRQDMASLIDGCMVSAFNLGVLEGFADAMRACKSAVL